jgi:hypothetical protein
MDDERAYWFPAKAYGRRWGMPARWPGWLVLALYVAGVVAAALVVPPDRSRAAVLACVAVLTAALLGVCRLKGEPPRWRWRGK